MIKLEDVKILNAEIGIAVKDGSELVGNNLEIQNSKHSDVITFVKKNYYGSAKASLKNLKSNLNKFINQKENILLINGIKVKETNFDKREIY